MSIILGGTNHKTSPLWLREKAALSGVSLFNTRKRILEREEFEEVVIVTTCNRVEFYGAGPDSLAAEESLKEFFRHEYRLTDEDLSSYFYFSRDKEAIRHVFTVITGADSMVVGESQISGQMQRSFEQARQEGTMGPEIERLANATVDVCKRVEVETEFSCGPVSIGSVAVEMAKEQLGTLKNRSTMILGAGEMGVLTARSLSAHGVGTILVVNRTLSRAQKVAHSLCGHAVDYTELEAQIEKVDVFVTSTSAPHVLIKRPMIDRIMEKRAKRPLIIIDLAVPRNVAHQVQAIKGVTLVNVDDLHKVASGNSKERMCELPVVKDIIEDETEKFRFDGKKKGMSLLDLALG
jgi:glutamyl-tRNA reductase